MVDILYLNIFVLAALSILESMFYFKKKKPKNQQNSLFVPK